MADSFEPNDLSHLSDEEFHALCPIGHHAPGPEPLSPAARAVLDAMSRSYDHEPTRRAIAAGILRALADHGEAMEIRMALGCFDFDQAVRCRDILAIADELEGADG